jgi:RNA recognition motif-containing protein
MNEKNDLTWEKEDRENYKVDFPIPSALKEIIKIRKLKHKIAYPDKQKFHAKIRENQARSRRGNKFLLHPLPKAEELDNGVEIEDFGPKRGYRLYVGNLNYSVTKEQLKTLFSKYGEVKEVNVIKNRGFGFIEMSEQSEAEKAKENLNGSEFMGRCLRVDKAQPPNVRQKKE